MKTLQQYFHMILFIFYVVLTFWVCGWNPMVLPFKWNLFSSAFTWCYLFSMSFQLKSYGVTIHMKPLQQYFHMILFILYVVLTFWVCRQNPMVPPFKKYLFSSTFTYHYSLFCIFPKKLISAWWYLFFRVLRKEVRFSVQLCSVGTLGKENDICIRFLLGEDKIILTKKKGLQQQTLNLKFYQHSSWG